MKGNLRTLPIVTKLQNVLKTLQKILHNLIDLRQKLSFKIYSLKVTYTIKILIFEQRLRMLLQGA